MAHSPLPNCVPVGVRDHPRYAGDHLIRHYRPLGLAAYLRDTGQDPSLPEAVIVGGIGRLVLRADGCDTWQPTIPEPADPGTVRLGEPAAAPRQAPDEIAEARRSICLTCDGWIENRCTVAGCSCNGMGQPGNLHSRCPRELWP